LQDVDLDKEMNNFINDELKELENIADTTLSEFSSSMRQDEEKYKDLTPEEKQSKLTELAKNAKEYEVLNNYEDAIKIYKEIVILAEDLALEVLKEKIQNKISELELKL